MKLQDNMFSLEKQDVKMNAYKLNGQAGHMFRMAVCKSLGIHWNDIYKTIEDVYTTDANVPIVLTKEGKKYKVVLEEILTP